MSKVGAFGEFMTAIEATTVYILFYSIKEGKMVGIQTFHGCLHNAKCQSKQGVMPLLKIS
jgi:hypothetical protein